MHYSKQNNVNQINHDFIVKVSLIMGVNRGGGVLI